MKKQVRGSAVGEAYMFNVSLETLLRDLSKDTSNTLLDLVVRELKIDPLLSPTLPPYLVIYSGLNASRLYLFNNTSSTCIALEIPAFLNCPPKNLH